MKPVTLNLSFSLFGRKNSWAKRSNPGRNIPCGTNAWGWLQHFQEPVREAKNMGEIAQTGSFSQKKIAALHVFGSNLFRGC
jgi:hypothetical protein